VFFFGGILFALLVTEKNNISDDKSDSNHGKWREIPGTAEKRDSEQTMRKVTGMTTKIKKQ
jgi:hypothetical protein